MAAIELINRGLILINCLNQPPAPSNLIEIVQHWHESTLNGVMELVTPWLIRSIKLSTQKPDLLLLVIITGWKQHHCIIILINKIRNWSIGSVPMFWEWTRCRELHPLPVGSIWSPSKTGLVAIYYPNETLRSNWRYYFRNPSRWSTRIRTKHLFFCCCCCCFLLSSWVYLCSARGALHWIHHDHHIHHIQLLVIGPDLLITTDVYRPTRWFSSDPIIRQDLHSS